MTQAVRDKLRGQKQAYKLRVKVEKGTATEEDKTRLAELEKAWGTVGRKAHGRRKADAERVAERDEVFAAKQRAVDADHDQAQDDVTPEGAADSGDGSPAVESPPPPSFEAPPEAPPRVEVLPAAARGGDWRAKYRAASGDGREATCLELASMYCGALSKVAAFIEASGSRPLFDGDYIERRIKPQAVLVADQLLPADFAISPEMEFVATSSALLGQGAIVALKRRAANKPKAQARPDPRPERAPLVSVPAVEPRPAETVPDASSAPLVTTPQPQAEPFVVGPGTLI